MLSPGELAQKLAIGFNMDELNTLCFHIGIQFERLSGDTIEAKAREAVKFAERSGMLEMLIVAATTERPNMFWTDAAGKVDIETFKMMLPSITSGTKRLMGMKMARFEGGLNKVNVRLSAQAACLRQTKMWVGASVVMSFLGLLKDVFA